MVRLAILLIALLAGCAQAPYIAYVDGLAVLHVPGGECPIEGQRSANGCYVRVDAAIFYDDKPTMLHERDHVLGLVHGPWVQLSGRNCAKVMAAGKTAWVPGEFICRASGDYYASR